jgi:phosphate acetyltransferase
MAGNRDNINFNCAIDMMKILDDIEQRSAKLNKTVVLPESEDPRVLKAASRILEKQNSSLILISDTEVPSGINTEHSSIEIRSWKRETEKQKFLELLLNNLEHKSITEEEADKMLASPLVYAGALVALGYADAAVAGSIATTASVIRSGLYTIGVSPESELVSSIFLMSLPNGKTITYSDCGVVPYPDSVQLASIAQDAGNTHQVLTGEIPRIAFLSFSTKGSARHERVDLVSKATEIAAAKSTGWIIDGELQFDAAFVPEIAKEKAPDSPLAGSANVFIFPNLDAGNIAYKITERVAGARATGPILQGLNKPYLDLSRGCSIDDIISAVHVAAVLSESG